MPLVPGGAEPPELLALCLDAVTQWDRKILDSFERRTWKAWEARCLEPLKRAVDARRKEFGG